MYRLQVAAGTDRSKVARAHQIHAAYCPVHKSIGACIEITTDIDVQEE